MTDERGGDVFLLLPLVLLDGGASVYTRRAVSLNLLGVGRLLEWVRAEGEGELSKTILPMGGRLPSKGTMSEQVSKESSPFLAVLGLADQDAEPFFAGIGRFVTFTLFSQPVGESLAYQNHPLSFTFHSNIADRLYFLAYATVDMVERRKEAKKQSRIGRNDCIKAIRRNERKPTVAQQLLLK